MTNDPASPLRTEARELAASVVASHADEIDRDARWPTENMQALGEAGLLGLTVDRELGGRGEGLTGLATVTEELGRVCGSTGLVYGMHCVAAKVIGVKPTAEQRERYLVPIAAGRHVTSLALAEPGSGVHFYLPRTTFTRQDDTFVLNGTKAFVTSGSHADSYVLSAVADSVEMDPGTFSCLLLDEGASGAAWLDPWDGFGMRGNSSRSLRLESVPTPASNLLGDEGDETWYVFEVIAPYFLVAMAGTYLGVAQSALDAVRSHLRERSYDHSGQPVGTAATVAHRLGGMWTAVERARQLLHHAAAMGDAGDPTARHALFACKAEIADVAVDVANEAMTLAGGMAYARHGPLSRALRDVRASPVMSPTTDLLKVWLGRSLLDLPLL